MPDAAPRKALADQAGSTRVESDTLGTVRVPADAYWGAETARSLANFPIGTEQMPGKLLHALVLIKKAAAQVNADLGLLAPELRDLIVRACDDVLAGEIPAPFPL